MSHVSAISTPQTPAAGHLAYRIQDDLVLYGAEPREPASVICRTSDCLALLMQPATGDILLHGEERAVKATFEDLDADDGREKTCITIPATAEAVDGLNALLAHRPEPAPSRKRRMAP